MNYPAKGNDYLEQCLHFSLRVYYSFIPARSISLRRLCYLSCGRLHLLPAGSKINESVIVSYKTIMFLYITPNILCKTKKVIYKTHLLLYNTLIVLYKTFLLSYITEKVLLKTRIVWSIKVLPHIKHNKSRSILLKKQIKPLLVYGKKDSAD